MTPVRHVWGYALDATVATASEVALNVVANSVTVPKRYYWLPLGIFIALAALRTAFNYRSDRKNPKSYAEKTFSSANLGTERILLQGKRKNGAGPIVLAIVATLFLFPIDVIALDGKPGFRNIAVGLTLISISSAMWIFAIVKTMIRGVRLEISREGVEFQEGRSRLAVSSNDVIEFRTQSLSPNGRNIWLVAEVPPGSPLLYQRPTSQLYDPKKKLLKLCCLDLFGIAQHEVDSALESLKP